MVIIRGLINRRLFWHSRRVWEDLKLPKDTSADVQRRLNKILEDVPKRQEKEVNTDTAFEVQEKIKAIKEDKGKPQNNYMNTFNIKQIVDTVREGENFKKLQEELGKFYETKWKEGKGKQEALSKRVDLNVKELRKSIAIASQVVNDVTGYSKVMKLRDGISDIEQSLKELRDKLHISKANYQSALDLRSNSQKEVNTLLERKNTWDQLDLERFTKLYMNNHDLENAVNTAANELKELEVEEEEIHDTLIKSIMNRYHEEQTWSDKIRQFSTWATVLILCANVTLVMLVQLVFEPLKRWRLVSSFEDKVRELFQGNKKLEQDLIDIKENLKEFEGKLLDQIDHKGPYSFIGGIFHGIYDYLNGVSSQASGFCLIEPEIIESGHLDMTRMGYFRVNGAKLMNLLHYQLIHQINIGLVFIYGVKQRVFDLLKVLTLTGNQSHSIAITALSSGAILGAFIGYIL